MNRALALLLLAACSKPKPADEDKIRPKVEAATGWTFREPPVYDKVDRAQLAARIEPDFAGVPGKRLEGYGRALEALRQLPRDYPLVATLKKAFVDEAAAVYLPRERKVLLVGDAPEIVVAHELVHALQHQHDPVMEILDAHEAELDDVKTAFHALLEGEATIHMLAITGQPIDESVRRLEEGTAVRLRSLPLAVKSAMLFPYFAGAAYVRRTVPELQGRSPQLHAKLPLSTEQLLHPGRDLPVAVFLPDLSPIVGKPLAWEGVFGEAGLAVALGWTGETAPIEWGFRDLRWAGDRVQLYGTDVVVLLASWDDVASSLGFRARLQGHWNGRDVAVVVGLPPAEAAKVARHALGRAVKKPFGSIADLRAMRPACPAEPALEEPDLGTAEIPPAAMRDPRVVRSHLLRFARERAGTVVGASRPTELPPDADPIEWSDADIQALAQGSAMPRGRSPLWARFFAGFRASWPQGARFAVFVRLALVW